MNNVQVEHKTGQLIIAGITSGVPKLFKRINDALKAKGLTVVKLVRIYSVIETAVKEIEAIVKEK